MIAVNMALSQHVICFRFHQCCVMIIIIKILRAFKTKQLLASPSIGNVFVQTTDSVLIWIQIAV